MKESLTLHFNIKDTLKNSFDIQKMDCINNDSITLRFLIRDRVINEKMPFTNILLTGLPNIKQLITTDTSGNAMFKVRKSQEEVIITAQYVGYKSFSLKIKPTECKEIKINLAAKGFLSNIDYDSIWKYRIRKKIFGKITLQKENSKITLTKVKNK